MIHDSFFFLCVAPKGNCEIFWGGASVIYDLYQIEGLLLMFVCARAGLTGTSWPQRPHRTRRSEGELRVGTDFERRGPADLLSRPSGVQGPQGKDGMSGPRGPAGPMVSREQNASRGPFCHRAFEALISHSLASPRRDPRGLPERPVLKENPATRVRMELL